MDLCPEYPVLGYTLYLGVEEEVMIEKSVEALPSPSPANTFLEVVIPLTEDEQYWYYLTATNSFGVSTPTTQVYTSKPS